MLYRNGHKFTLCVRCCPPPGEPVPVIYAQLAGLDGMPIPVVGKVDTGASRTILNFDTARILGMSNPKSGALSAGKAITATDAQFHYYVHEVFFHISDDMGNSVFFPLKTAFAEKVKRNLFGVDWLEHLCLAVDREAVHLLMH